MKDWRALVVLGLSLSLGLWGIEWCLPSRERLLRVLPAEVDTPEFREHLAKTWQERYKSFGDEPMKSPLLWAKGFDRSAATPAGWKLPPEQLTNPTRSFFLRTGFDDESNYLVCLSRIRPQRLEFNPRIYAAYGDAYFFAVGAWMALVAMVTPAKLVPSISYYLAHLDKLAWLYLAGRLFSAAMQVVSAVLLYWIGRRYWSPGVGLWAGLFFAVAPGNVLLTHFMKPGPMGFAALLGLFFFCAEILRGRDDRSRWRWAGVMLGVAAGATNYLWNGGLLLLITMRLRARRHGADWRKDFRFACEAVLIALALYLLTNPFLILEYKTAWPMMAMSPQHSNMRLSEVWRWAWVGFPKALTVPLAGWALLGLIAKGTRADSVRSLAAASLLGYLGMAWILQGGDQFMSIRHFPGIFMACLLAACLIEEWSGAARPWLAGAARGAAILSFSYAFLVSAVMDYNYHLESVSRSTKQAAGDWIERNVPAGGELGLLRLPQPSNLPYFQWNRYRLRFVELEVLARETSPGLLPEHLIITAENGDARIPLRPFLDGHYDVLKSFEPFRPWGLGPPPAEMFGNPLIEIYKRKPFLPVNG